MKTETTQRGPGLPAEHGSASMSREEVALSMFTALLPQSIKRANEMLFPEGAKKVMKDEIAAAWEMADIWISERPDYKPFRERIWCAWCGEVADHGSGSCPNIQRRTASEISPNTQAQTLP